MDTIGDISLLDRHLIGFLAGSKIAALSVLPTLDWASDVAAREDVSIVSGFQSQLEHQVLEFLLRGRCGIICVLARSLYKRIPCEFKEAFSQGRILFVSEEKQSRPSIESASRRNRLVVSMANELIIPSLSPESSLNSILTSANKKITIL